MRALRVLATLALAGPLVATAATAFPIREIRELTPENPPFSRNVYGCLECTLEEFQSVTPPPGFMRSSAADSPASSAERRPVPDAPGVPETIFVDGIEFELFAQVQTAQILDFATQTVIADVERDTTFFYDAGSTVHELLDPDGATWLLFVASVENPIPGVGLDPDLDQLGALDGLPLPDGWTYSSRILSEALVVESGGLAQVFNVGGEIGFQRLEPIPEPTTALLLATGLTALAARRRRLH